VENEWGKFISSFKLNPIKGAYVRAELLLWLDEQLRHSNIQKAANRERTARYVYMLIDNIKAARRSNSRPYTKDGFDNVFEVAAQAFPGKSSSAIENLYKSVKGKNDIGVIDPLQNRAWFSRQIAIIRYMTINKTWDISRLPANFIIEPEAILPPEWFQS
jgi:hypothetical protein